MKEINYLEIIKNSWRITWSNKYLWWFGLFLSLGGSGNFNFNFPQNDDWKKQAGNGGEAVASFLSRHSELFIVIILIAIILGIALIVLKIISQAGLIKTLNKIETTKEKSFRKGFREGKKYFWKLLSIGLILGFLILALVFVLAVPVVFLFYLHAIIFGVLAALLAIAIFIPLVIIASFIGKYAGFYIILSDLGIGASIERGYQIFRKNIRTSIIMALFFIPISMALAFAIFFIILIIGLIFLAIGALLYLIFSKIGIAVAVISGIMVLLASIILLSSVYQVFYQTTWLLFFKEIASVKEEKKVAEALSSVVDKSVASPEKA
jgi:hypothetical protein